MKKSRKYLEIAFVLGLMLFLIILTENILKESSFFNINIAIWAIYLIVASYSMYHFFFIVSNLSLYVSFKVTRRKVFLGVLKKSGLIILATSIFTFLIVLLNMVFRKEEITILKLFFDSRLLYFVSFFFFLVFFGVFIALLKFKRSEMVIKHILLLLAILVVCGLIFINSIYVIVGFLLVSAIMFFLCKDLYYNKCIEI